jgi:predicted MFS family arabinose efflux permease
MALLTHAAEDRGLDYGYAFALMNLAWAPGQSGGAALGGAVADATSDAVPYLALSGLAALTLFGLTRSGAFRGPPSRPAAPSAAQAQTRSQPEPP